MAPERHQGKNIKDNDEVTIFFKLMFEISSLNF
jgi:hypothetical protein